MPRQKKHKKIILGVTGIFGSGKTTVSRLLQNFGAELIDADKIGHEVVLSGTQAYLKIVAVFGAGILKKNKEINRQRLGEIVFKDTKALLVLEKIVHPQIILEIKRQIKESRKNIIVLDAPLLIEARLERLVDKLVVVSSNEQKLIERLKNKTPLTRKEILRRIRCQISLNKKIRLADFVIDNNGSLEETKKQVKKVLERVKINPVN